MPLRVLRDGHAVVRQVWDVRPSWLAATKQVTTVSASARPLLQPALADGWLTFESASGERRRMVPIPAGWDAMDDVSLDRLLTRATPIPPRPRRLIE
jgi:hypothetical protein